MDASPDAQRTAGDTAPGRRRLRSIAKIVIFDVAAPLAAYRLLRSAGLSAVTALLLSGVFPAFGVAIVPSGTGGLTWSAPWSWPGSWWARCSA